jgi:hypothetical protein
MSKENGASRNLSGLGSTPELKAAIKLAQNNGRWNHIFYTTIWHIVTKILDMDITFTLPDGSTVKPFTTVWEVNAFFRIDSSSYNDSPMPNIMDYFVSNIYRDRVKPKEKSILAPQKEWVKDFFETNIWWDVNDDDTIDTLLWKIDELAQMGIPEVSERVCTDLKEWIVIHCIWIWKELTDWHTLSEEERNEHKVEYLDKNECTKYFSDNVIEYPWRKHPNNPHRYMMNFVQPQIHALYRVDREFEKSIGEANWDQFRNTRYL